jgi:hypothetical protein
MPAVAIDFPVQNPWVSQPGRPGEGIATAIHSLITVLKNVAIGGSVLYEPLSATALAYSHGRTVPAVGWYRLANGLFSESRSSTKSEAELYRSFRARRFRPI